MTTPTSFLVLLLSVLVGASACGDGRVVAGRETTAADQTATSGSVASEPASRGPSGSGPVVTGTTSDVPAGTDPPTEASATAQLMAAALRRLVDDHHGFPSEAVTTFFVRRAVDPGAGVTGGDTDSAPQPDREEPVGCCGRPLSDDELAAIEATLAPAGTVQLIDDPADWITDDLAPKVSGGVILGVGEPEIDGDTALVSVSMWCGGLCGTWLSYRAERTAGGGWRIVGPDGPIAIA